MGMNKDNLILIADSHIREGSAEEFFAMLARIREYAPRGVVFLGDIFELWVALDGYESGIHRRFLDWCRESKELFEVGFIVGNHEFYLEKYHPDAFSWIDLTAHTSPDGLRFVHGDLINRGDLIYRGLRQFLRNPLTRLLLKLTGRTIGPRVAEKVRTSLKAVNLPYQRKLPVNSLFQYARFVRTQSVRKIYAGHFHRHEQLDHPDGVPLEILPAWATAGEIVCHAADGSSRCAPWRELLIPAE